MIARNIKRKLLKARIKLGQTLQSILYINREKKQLPHLAPAEAQHKEMTLMETLKVLNKTAANQAKMIRRYEEALGTVSEREDKPSGKKGSKAA